MTPILNRSIRHAASRIIFAGLLCFSVSVPASAQDGAVAAGNAVILELNKTEDTGGNCRLSFVMKNGTGSAVPAASYELVLFTADGVINQMSVFDFGALPVGKTVVRQFELPALPCAQAGQLLINGPAGCSGNTPSPHCSAPLELSSRTALSLTQ